MKIQKGVNAGPVDGSDMPQYIGRFRIVQLRLKVYVEPLKAVGDSPAKQGKIVLGRPRHCDGLKELEHALLVSRFNDDDRHARSKNQFKVALSIH